MKYPMVKKHIKTLGIILFLLAHIIQLGAQIDNIPKPFSPPRLVNDFVNLLSKVEYQRLEQKLVAYSDTTSIQIAVVLNKTTGGENIVTYSQRLAESWGIGQDDTDNGILILVSTEDRGLRIHTGYGVEGFLPDGMARRIIDQVLVPNFRRNQYYEGLDRATDIIKQLGTGEYQAVAVEKNEGLPLELIFLVFIILIIVISVINSKDRWDDGDDGGYYRGGQYEDYGRKHRRNRGGWVIMPGSRGSFGNRGGGFSGGFGGFGGGSFGGGGASGSW